MLFHRELGSFDLYEFGVITGLLQIVKRAGHLHQSPGTNEIVTANGQLYELIQGPAFVAAGQFGLNIGI